jgi:hypothetical protein
MANEFTARNGIIAKNNSVITGSLIVTQGITGSLFGTASFATSASYALSASQAQTASYVLNAVSASFSTLAQTSNTASYVVTAQTASYVLNAVSSSLAQTASFVTTAQTASYVVTAQTASYVLNAISSSFAISASYVLNAISSSYAITASKADQVKVIDNVSSLLYFPLIASSTAGYQTVTTVSGISYDADNAILVGTFSGDLEGTANNAFSAQTASYVQNAQTASYVTGSIHTSANPALSASYALTASYAMNAGGGGAAFPYSGSAVITGSLLISGSGLTIGTNSLGANENTLTLGAPPAGGSGEGGQLGLNAAGGTYTSASFIDNYQNQIRILRGSNVSSDALVTQWNLHTKQMQLPAYTNASAFAGTATANLAVDSSGNVITVSTSGGTVFPYTGNAVITGSLTTTGVIYAQPNGGMYFQGGDDAALHDINVANTMGVYGLQDSTVGAIKLGSSGPVLYGSGSRLGIGTTTPSSASLTVNGNIWATSITGSFTGSLVGSLTGTASYATQAQTASYVLNAVSASRATSAGTADIASKSDQTYIIVNALTNTYFAGLENSTGVYQTLTIAPNIYYNNDSEYFVAPGFFANGGSFTGNLIGTADNATNATSASYALTASYAMNGGGGGASTPAIRKAQPRITRETYY